MIRVSIVGAAGYAGGELIRLLIQHPHVELVQVTSRSKAGKFIHSNNPNLRKFTTLKYCHPTELEECDVLFLCMPHGRAMEQIETFQKIAPKLIDLSADFRLHQPDDYLRWYGKEHVKPALLGQFTYGVPELHREKIAESSFVACAGCNATAVILAVSPIVGAVDVQSIVVNVKVGSSEAGNQSSDGSHHPVRSGAVRSYRPTGHRHAGEVVQELNFNRVWMSATAIEMVRGSVATCQIFTTEPAPTDKELWKIYRSAYGKEPFIRIVKDRSGIHRYPEPKYLAGSNYCDVGFERDPDGSRVVVMSAMDNLMKGAAGQAVQNFNIMHRLPERTGLEFTGLHPV